MGGLGSFPFLNEAGAVLPPSPLSPLPLPFSLTVGKSFLKSHFSPMLGRGATFLTNQMQTPKPLDLPREAAATIVPPTPGWGQEQEQRGLLSGKQVAAVGQWHTGGRGGGGEKEHCVSED